MKIQFTITAHKEFLEAVEYYNVLREGLGYEFSMEVDEGIQKIEQFTDAWQEIKVNIRRFLIKRFPYGIIYTKDEERILILSIMNLHKGPADGVRT